MTSHLVSMWLTAVSILFFNIHFNFITFCAVAVKTVETATDLTWSRQLFELLYLKIFFFKLHYFNIAHEWINLYNNEIYYNTEKADVSTVWATRCKNKPNQSSNIINNLNYSSRVLHCEDILNRSLLCARFERWISSPVSER